MTMWLLSVSFSVTFKVAVIAILLILIHQCFYNPNFVLKNENLNFLENLKNFEGEVVEMEGGLIKIYKGLTGVKQDDPRLIRFIKEKVIIKPDGKPLQLKELKTFDKMGGQYGQPFAAENILNLDTTNVKKAKGFYIEAGAAGGEFIANTLLFEKKHNWTGLLVEPNPDLLRELLSKHRQANILPHCLSTKPEVEIVKFDVSKYVSGIENPGKARPSRLESQDKDRASLFYEREIEVIFFIQNKLTKKVHPELWCPQLYRDGATYMYNSLDVRLYIFCDQDMFTKCSKIHALIILTNVCITYHIYWPLKMYLFKYIIFKK